MGFLSGKFEKSIEELSHTAIFISEIAVTVMPGEKITVLSDDPDNRVLECAVEGGASKIVTGDKAMLSLGVYETIEIISLRKYLSDN